MSVNESASTARFAINLDIPTLIRERQYSMALIAMYKEGNPKLHKVFPALDYHIGENSTEISDIQVELLIQYVNQMRVSTLVESLGLVLIGGLGVLLGFIGFMFFFQRTPGVMTLNVAIAPVLCMGLPFGLPICFMGIKGLRTLRLPTYGIWR